jgi:hypothetical protein
MKTITFKLHSFIDLITNSSSETFIQCTDNTKDAIKSIINHLLLANNITDVTCDDIFNINVANNDITINNLTDKSDYDIVAKKLSSLVHTYDIETEDNY